MVKKAHSILGYQALFIIGPLLGVVNLKILTNSLTLTQFSNLQLVIPVVEWVVLIGVLGAPQFVLRYWSKLSSLEIINVAKLFSAFILCLAIVVVSLIVPHMGIRLSEGSIYLIVIVCVLQGGFKYALSITRAQLKHAVYLSLAVLQKILLTAFLLIGSVFIVFTIEAYLTALIIAFALPLLLFLYLAKDKLKSVLISLVSYSFYAPRELFKYGIPVVVVMLLGDILVTGNRYVLNANGLNESVGVYAVYVLVSTLAFQVLIEPAVGYFHPIFFKLYDESKEKFEVVFSAVTNLLILLGLYLSVQLVKYEEFIISTIANDAYIYSNENFIIVVVLSGFFSSLYRLFSTLFYIEKNTSGLAYFVAISLIISLSLGLFLVRDFALMGVAFGYLISQFFLAVCLIVKCFYRIKFDFELKMFLAPLAAVSISGAIDMSLSFSSVYYSILVDLCIAGLLCYFLINRLMVRRGLINSF